MWEDWIYLLLDCRIFILGFEKWWRADSFNKLKEGNHSFSIHSEYDSCAVDGFVGESVWGPAVEVGIP